MLSPKFATLVLFAIVCASLNATVKDAPFRQDLSVKFAPAPELSGAIYHKLAIDRDGIVYVLTSRGVARLFDATLALDKSFRPLTGQRALDMTLHDGRLFYLFDDRFLSNGSAGEPLAHLSHNVYRKFAVADNGAVFLAGTNNLALWSGGVLKTVPISVGVSGIRL